MNVDIAKELPTVISFCSGYGGIERGLDIAGVEHRVLAFLEIEAFAIANLVNKMEDRIIPPAPIYTDIKTFPSHLFRGKVSILTGGYPCQPFSAAGKRLGADDPRHLWPHIRRHIEAIRPARCFFENVEGHISLGLSSVISDLEEDCYRATWGIFSAREVGAPHQRKRVYILAESNNDRHKQNPKRDAEESGVQGEYWSEVCRGMPDRASYESTAELGHSENNRCERWSENFKRERSENYIERSDQDVWSQSKRPSQTLADSNNGQRELKDQEIRARRDSAVDGGKYLADADGAGQQAQTIRCATECSDRGSWDGHSDWPSEPGLGRVVDGCADRVDRIRLLGNGVVPATAAKAWRVLNETISLC